jgi:CubicO group peptidase (beta-lactamase class C family)
VIDDQTQRLLEARLASEQAEGRLPSVTAGLIRDGRLAWSGGRGRIADDGGQSRQPDADVQYRAGSITKTFVAVAVLRLRDAGRLSLADPVGRHVSGCGAAAGLTIGQLLSHSSGLRAETAGPWWERTPGTAFEELAAGSLGDDAPRWRPGRRFHYSNVGYALLGELLARQHGMAWDAVIAAELLQPLGMRRTTTRPQPPHATGLAVHPHADLLLPEPEHDAGAMAPAGQLWTTVADLGRWARFLAGDTGGLLAAGTLAEMREPQAIEDAPGQPWTAGYGLGLQLWNDGGARSFGHSGSMPGFTGMLRIAGESGDAAVALCNSTTGFSGDLTGDLLAILARSEPPGREDWTAAGADAEADAEAADLLGTWYWGPAPHTVTFSGGVLTVQSAGGRSRTLRFRRGPDGSWAGIDGYHAGEPLVALRRDDRRVTALDIGSFVFTRVPYDPQAPVPGGVDPQGWRPGLADVAG